MKPPRLKPTKRWYDAAEAMREARDKLMQDTMWSTDGEKVQALLFATQALMTQIAERFEAIGKGEEEA